MKTIKREKQKDKYERYKLASIPILLCVLAYVLWGPSEVEEQTVAESPESTQLTLPLTAQATTQSKRTSANSVTKLSWPEVDLQFLSQSNPFANYLHQQKGEDAAVHMVSRMADNQTAATDQLANMGRELSQQTVDYVFQSNARKIVRLGEKVFEQGEYLSDSVQLHEIQHRALILKLAEPDGEVDATSTFQ